jgi:predicted signal transduction protein with EAL and GGDEF domain
MIALPKFAHWSLKAKFALCSGALMFVFSVAFTTWTLRGVQTDLRSSIVDAQRALLRSTARDVEAKIELRRDALATIAALLSEAAPSQGAQMDAFFAPRPVLLLKVFARRLQQNMRSTDTVTRLGGDEFVVILEGLRSDEEPQLVARKILAGIDHPFEVDGRPLNVTTSVGIAFHTSAAEGAADLLGRADAALYQAKAAGRNTVRLSTA